MRRLRLIVIALATLSLLLPSARAQESTGDDEAARRTLRRSPVVEVFESCRDAVVNISSTEIVTVRRGFGIDLFFEDFFDMPTRTRQLKRTSVGSGFVIHPDGYIVTNAHVVAHTVERRVTFADGREFEAEIIAADADRDIAMLKISTDSPLPTLRLGRSEDLMVGETVIAIGNPLGYQHTVTAGVVSATDRELPVARDRVFTGLIQTDASINPGNSGGPLLNVLGELIGINTAIRGDAQNIGFAIAVDHLRELLPELLDVERRYRIVAGMRVDSLNEPRVVSIVEGSPAQAAGVEVGDVVVAVNGTRVRTGVDYYIAMIDRQPGERIPIRVRRSDRVVDASIVLAERPRPDGVRLAAERMGLELQPLPDDLAGRLGVRADVGLIVAGVERGGPADRLGIARADILLAVGRHYVSSVDDLGQILEETQGGETVSVTILRTDRRSRVQMSGQLRLR